jgi:hypothetical protein
MNSSLQLIQVHPHTRREAKFYRLNVTGMKRGRTFARAGQGAAEISVRSDSYLMIKIFSAPPSCDSNHLLVPILIIFYAIMQRFE